MRDNWFKRNYKNIIRISYIIPILVAAGISIYHVITWYDMTNPFSWAIYLSIGVEIAALSALAGMTAKMSKFVYVPFIIVTFIQILGNVFASYQYIDVNGHLFKSWVELFDPIFNSFGWVENGDIMTHKRILGILGGIFIPLISLSFLHLLISFNDKTEKNEGVNEGINEGVNTPIKDVWVPVEKEKITRKGFEATPSVNKYEIDDSNDTQEVMELSTNSLSEDWENEPDNWQPSDNNGVHRKFVIPVGEKTPENEPIYEVDKESFGETTEEVIEEPTEEVNDAQLTIDFDKDYSLVTTEEAPEIEVLPNEEAKINESSNKGVTVVKTDKRAPVIPTGKVEHEEIQEVKNRNRGFSVNIPKSEGNKKLNKLVYKRGRN